MNEFCKYHALGNDYLVCDPKDWQLELTPPRIRRFCDRHFGAGSDGILYGPLPAADNAFALRIFNPDGSEAEKSGNGLRIFTRYLWDSGRISLHPFQVVTKGGIVTCRVIADSLLVEVAMGQVSFDSREIPVTGAPREVLREEMKVAGVTVCYCAATIGNPHCVVLNQAVTPETAYRLGPGLETEPRFLHRTNVQFLEVLDPGTIRLEIWERGAGYTLASGSSASAAAAVARRLGLCGPDITVRMPGGDLKVRISPDYHITQTGPVTAVAWGELADDLAAELENLV